MLLLFMVRCASLLVGVACCSVFAGSWLLLCVVGWSLLLAVFVVVVCLVCVC